MLHKVMNTFLSRFGMQIRSIPPDKGHRLNVVSLRPEVKPIGNVLLAYILQPFLQPAGTPIANFHTQHWESWQMARTFLDMGFVVDVIDYRNNMFTPKKDYDYFVSARTNFSRIAPLLPEKCIKIVHQDTSHWLDNNVAALQRCLDVKNRRLASLSSLKFVHMNSAMEHADYATVLGNEFTMRTFRYAGKPLFRIPISTCGVYPWNEQKDFDVCRNSFLWFGSRGFVHKGLDLALEAFCQMPECELYVCGPMAEEKAFVHAFKKELHLTPNIHTIGWIDVTSTEFSALAEKCVGTVYPSCAEGGGGCVIQCMHAGLLPLATYESSVDVQDDFGVLIKGFTVDDIKEAVQSVTRRPAEELKTMSRRAWEFARTHHTREHFAAAFRETIETIMATHRRGSCQDCPDADYIPDIEDEDESVAASEA